MTIRHPLIFWLTAILGILLGVPMGIAAAQNALVAGIPLALGWLYLPALCMSFPKPDLVSHVQLWLLWLIWLYYPMATLLTALYGYLAQLRTGTKRPSWRLFGLLMSIICVTSLISCFISPSFNANDTVFPGALVLFPWVNILISTILGWGLACLIPRPMSQAAL